MWILEFYKKRKIEKLKGRLGKRGCHTFLAYPFNATSPEHVFLGDYAKVLNHAEIINPIGSFYVGRYAIISTHLTVVTDNHTPTVGIPISFTATLHINEKTKDVVVGDDCWLGTHVTLLPGAEIGRGSVVGANTVCNKITPPYAILVGVPAKIVGVKFTLEQIIMHEKQIYPKEERMTRQELEQLFATYYEGKKVLGTDFLSKEDGVRVESYMQSLGFTPYK